MSGGLNFPQDWKGRWAIGSTVIWIVNEERRDEQFFGSWLAVTFESVVDRAPDNATVVPAQSKRESELAWSSWQQIDKAGLP